MRLDRYQFPHPVLSPFSDDIKGAILFMENIHEKKDRYLVSIKCEFDNALLNSLLDSGNAEIICQYTCSSTVLRGVQASLNKELAFELSKADVRGKVQFETFLTAKNQISGYANPDSHSDYRGITFEIEKGDVLAGFGSFEFNASINYKKLEAVASFLKIEERSDIDQSDIDLENDRIIVQLPIDDFWIYKKQPVMKEEEFASVFHSSIVFGALIYALTNIGKHEDRLWADVIKSRMESDEDLKKLDLDNSNDVYKIAQILLGNPISRMLGSLDRISQKI